MFVLIKPLLNALNPGNDPARTLASAPRTWPADRYADERLADQFHQRYRDARTALRHKAHADS